MSADAINFIKQAKQFGLTDKMPDLRPQRRQPVDRQAVARGSGRRLGQHGLCRRDRPPASKAFVAAWKVNYGAEPTDYEGGPMPACR